MSSKIVTSDSWCLVDTHNTNENICTYKHLHGKHDRTNARGAGIPTATLHAYTHISSYGIDLCFTQICLKLVLPSS